MTEYPYMVSNNKIAPIVSKIQTAAKPQKFTQEFLKNIGFTSSNDRAIISVFKKLGFLTEDGTPTVYYDQLRDKSSSQIIMANRIRDLYAELFTINTEIYSDTDANIKGAISRVTGGDEKSVNRVFSTFKALCNIANFNSFSVLPITSEVGKEDQPDTHDKVLPQNPHTEFHYNIQIHLPATTDISVYNAIFKSLKENLMI